MITDKEITKLIDAMSKGLMNKRDFNEFRDEMRANFGSLIVRLTNISKDWEENVQELKALRLESEKAMEN